MDTLSYFYLTRYRIHKSTVGSEPGSSSETGTPHDSGTSTGDSRDSRDTGASQTKALTLDDTKVDIDQLGILLELYSGNTALSIWESNLDHLFIESLIDYTCEFRKGTNTNSKDKKVVTKEDTQSKEHRKKMEAGLNDLLKNMGTFTAEDGKNIDLKKLLPTI